MKRTAAIFLSIVMGASLLAGCGGSSSSTDAGAAAGSTAAASTEAAAAETSSDAKVLNFGCQMYGDGLIDPTNQTNAAWNCMRFGIGETLFRFDDSMSVQPWLAEKAETEDYTTWVITLKEGDTDVIGRAESIRCSICAS